MKRVYFMAAIDGVFYVDTRVIYDANAKRYQPSRFSGSGVRLWPLITLQTLW